MSGRSVSVAFADDFVVSFQFRQDADHFQQKVRERFAEFGLELAEEETRRMLFGRFAGVTRLRHGLGRPETFEFLCFKHVCGVDRAGRFALILIPSVKSCRKFLARTRGTAAGTATVDKRLESSRSKMSDELDAPERSPVVRTAFCSKLAPDGLNRCLP